jgi:MSHA pilin protein MshD
MCSKYSPQISRCRQQGISLLELVLSIVIIGVSLAGMVTVFSQSVRGSADPLVRKQMLAIAEEMLEEVMLKPFTASVNGTSATACARNAFNDIDDYNNYSNVSAGGVCDIDGTVIPGLAGYIVAVTVTNGALNGVAAKSISVSVTRGGNVLTLNGWRTGWAL